MDFCTAILGPEEEKACIVAILVVFVFCFILTRESGANETTERAKERKDSVTEPATQDQRLFSTCYL